MEKVCAQVSHAPFKQTHALTFIAGLSCMSMALFFRLDVCWFLIFAIGACKLQYMTQTMHHWLSPRKRTFGVGKEIFESKQSSAVARFSSSVLKASHPGAGPANKPAVQQHGDSITGKLLTRFRSKRLCRFTASKCSTPAARSTFAASQT